MPQHHHHLLEHLNEPQIKAVSSKPGNMLVLAGAGSGKTRVLVHRIAWLVHELAVSPYEILAVTFTNKAATEIKSRVEKILNLPINGMWLGTFHGIAHRLLRSHYDKFNLDKTFQILDSEDQKRLVKKAIQSLNLDENVWQVKEAQWFINLKKDQGLRPSNIPEQFDEHSKVLLSIYTKYEKLCKLNNLVDFADLLLLALELWQQHPEVLAHYQNRFKFLLVDEFQDTNTVQYKWLKLLAGKNIYTTIVGDDDQSIYGWRGAKIENIQKFSRDFEAVDTIRLEQNYRSTGVILNAANHLIKHNESRLGKNLWSASSSGEPINIYAAFNEIDEAKFVKNQILAWLNNGGQRKDAAILYRSNAQSRVIEEQLIQSGIPYKVFGGLRFFERAEIKDALAYLRLISNHHDDPAFERVINHPNRGIGERSLAIIRQFAREHESSLWQSTGLCIENKLLPPRALMAVESFMHMIKNMKADIEDQELDVAVDTVIKSSGLKLYFQSQTGEKARQKLENLEELVNAAKNYGIDAENDLVNFLAHASLEAGDNQAQAYEDSVHLMTLHTAKGLEFPLVFLVGVEEGLFPSKMSLDEPGKLQEERRLCYVGMTRAMEKLFVSYAEVRRLYGKDNYHRPSRFIGEMGTEGIMEVRQKLKMPNFTTSSSMAKAPSNAFGPIAKSASKDTPFNLGQSVAHAKFGEGVVLAMDGTGDNCRIRVNFKRFGVKTLILQFAKLKPL